MYLGKSSDYFADDFLQNADDPLKDMGAPSFFENFSSGTGLNPEESTIDIVRKLVQTKTRPGFSKLKKVNPKLQNTEKLSTIDEISNNEEVDEGDVDSHMQRREVRTILKKFGFMNKPPLTFKIIEECPVTKARAAVLTLPHGPVNTPVFMPVGTQGTVKSLLPQQVEALGCQIILGNTYHLGSRPGQSLISKAGGLHNFMGWKRSLLTDSGGFQMVSLLELAEITEEGVKFKSPYGAKDCMLTPEHSIKIQNDLGADIAMQLDDVVSSTVRGPRVEEAMLRTTRWLDRCLKAHSRPDDQNIFPIIQGGLDPESRKKSVELQCQRKVNGFAIGGLSGGESKDEFWKMVNLSTDLLPPEKPRYLMGVGYAEDMLICSALGVDMFDCVYPTRTARFGSGLTFTGRVNLNLKSNEFDFRPIEDGCKCITCSTYTRSYLNSIMREPSVCSLISAHNIHFQMNFMRLIQENIINHTFPDFIKYYMRLNYPKRDFPQWAVDALACVSVSLDNIDTISDKVILSPGTTTSHSESH